MSLTRESQLGPYRILGLIGAGAMGEVYRARDTRLGRDVAVKTISAGASTESFGRRLEDEARAASALNHPNILTIHDVGQEGGRTFVVSELVEGESLRSVMLRGPLPLKQVLDIGIQIAEGLAAAHEAGIVHRDLKPENVMVTRDGRVKILDFGLAKPVLGPDAPSDSEATAPGVLLGTTAYMSPEQARGSEASFFSDQFALGVILHEMATGRPLFKRANPLETLTAVAAEPAPEIEVGPVAFRWLVMRCLHKQPDHRYASTAQIARELRSVRDQLQTATGELTPWPEPAPAHPAEPQSQRLSPALLLGILCVLAAAAVGYAAARYLSRPAFDLAELRYIPFAAEPGLQLYPSWSPNGRSLAYSTEVDQTLQIAVRSMNSAAATILTASAEDCLFPFWSPDGNRVFYIARRGSDTALWSVGATGGAPELLLESVARAAVSPDGRWLAALRASGTGVSLWLGPLAPLRLQRYTEAPVASAALLPNAQLAFSRDSASLGLWMSLANGTAELWRIPVPAGSPERVLRAAGGLPVPQEFTWLPDGRLVYSELAGHLWLAGPSSGAHRRLTAGTAAELSPAASPDGTHLAFASAAIHYDVVEIPLAGGAAVPVMDSRMSEASPSVGPDGELLFVSSRSGSPEIWLRAADGALERPLVTQSHFGSDRTALLLDTAFSPDGRRFAFRRVGASGDAIWVATVAGDPPVRLTPGARDESQRGPAWSPDGQWIVYSTVRNGRSVLMRVRPGSTDPPQEIAAGAGSYPRWSPDGKWIAASRPDGGLSIVSPEGRGSRRLGSGAWLVHGWADPGRLIGIRRDPERRLAIVSVDLAGEETVLSDLGLAPAAYTYAESMGAAPLRGFSIRSDGQAFLTSVIRADTDLWLLRRERGSF